jgi:peroxiredoxin
MRKTLLFVALATALFTVSTQAKVGAVPRKSPEFVIQMIDGPQQLLSSYKGKTIALAFMYTTCPHCQKTAQALSKVQTEYAAKGVQVVGVTFDQGAETRISQFNKGLGLNFPCGYANGPSVLTYMGMPPDEPYFVPIVVFIDKNFNIRSQYVGDEKFLENQEVNIRAELDKYIKAPLPARAAASK